MCIGLEIIESSDESRFVNLELSSIGMIHNAYQKDNI